MYKEKFIIGSSRIFIYSYIKRTQNHKIRNKYTFNINNCSIKYVIQRGAYLNQTTEIIFRKFNINGTCNKLI